MNLAVGNVYVVYCNYIKNPHDKISLCFCAEKRFFFWFNSTPSRHGIAQLAVAANEHPAITKDCFLDLSGIRVFQPNEISANDDRGPISTALRARIVAELSNPIKLLPEAHRLRALGNL